MSEDFIREFADKVDWCEISRFQKLSEDFIREFADSVNWDMIRQYQTLSPDFISEFNLTVPMSNWNYVSDSVKREIIENSQLTDFAGATYALPYKYEWDGDYLIGYKAVRNDGYSLFNKRFCYVIGQTYESHCDCNPVLASFGLSLCSLIKSGGYGIYTNQPYKLFKVKTHISDIGYFDPKSGIIRCSKLTIEDDAELDSSIVKKLSEYYGKK